MTNIIRSKIIRDSFRLFSKKKIRTKNESL